MLKRRSNVVFWSKEAMQCRTKEATQCWSEVATRWISSAVSKRRSNTVSKRRSNTVSKQRSNTVLKQRGDEVLKWRSNAVLKRRGDKVSKRRNNEVLHSSAIKLFWKSLHTRIQEYQKKKKKVTVLSVTELLKKNMSILVALKGSIVVNDVVKNKANK